MRLIKKLRKGDIVQQNDATTVNKPIVTSLPMDDSLDSTIKRINAFDSAVTDEERSALPYPTNLNPETKFYMDLALFGASEKERQEILRRYYSTPTIGPTNIAAQTGHMRLDPKTGDVIGWTAPTVKVNNLPGAWQQMTERALSSPAFQLLASIPTMEIPFIFKGLNSKILPNGIERSVGLNGKIRFSLPSHTQASPRQLVLEPAGNNKFRPHIRIWDPGHVPGTITPQDKNLLYQTMYDALPNGAELLFPETAPGFYGTRGTVAGLQRLGRDPRFIRGTRGTLQYIDKDGTIKSFESTSFIKAPQRVKKPYTSPQVTIDPVSGQISTGDTMEISPEELYKFLKQQEGYYFYGHGTGRTHVDPQVIFNSGLRIKNGDIANTTTPITEANLGSWPHLNSDEIIILPGKVESVKYDAPFGHIPTDWFDNNTFHWTDNPKMIGRGLFARSEPHASFIESTKNGMPGVFTKPEAVLGSYNTRTHTFRFNPNSQYKFQFNTPSPITIENAKNITPQQWTAAQDAAILRGDWDEVYRLSDLHFRTKVSEIGTPLTNDNGKLLRLYRGAQKDENVFTSLGPDNPVWATTDRHYAINYTKPRSYDTDGTLRLLKSDPNKVKNLYGVYGKKVGPIENLDNVKAHKIMQKDNFDTDLVFGHDYKVDHSKIIGFNDSDGIEYAFSYPTQLKSADPVTYDNFGKRIGLGDRHNFSNPDIRWVLLPWTIGGTASYKFKYK